MNRLLRVLGTAGLMVWSVGLIQADDKQEQAALQGKWAVVSVEREGKADAKWVDALRTMDGNKYTIVLKDGEKVGGAYTIDSAKKPHAMDITPAGGTFKGKVLPAIYVVEGDTLKICFDGTGKERPTEFVSKPGSGWVLAVHKRAKP